MAGRLDQLIFIPPPDYEARLDILRAKLRKTPLAEDVNLAELARSTEGFSGADLAEITQQAVKMAIGECVKAKKEEFDRRKATMGEDEIPDMSDWARPVSQITKAHLD